MDNVIVQVIVENLLEIVSAVVISLIGILGAWVTTKLAKNKDLENVAKATEEVQLVAEKTVRELQQTMVEGFKEANADGKLTKEEISMLNKALLDKTMADMSVPAIKVLNAAGVDISALITTFGESIIQKIKLENK